MSDLAREAAEHLTRIVWGDFGDPEEGVADIIRSHGTLVSHEDAALLWEFVAMVERQRDFNDDGDGMMIERVKAALDAAGVPKAEVPS